MLRCMKTDTNSLPDDVEELKKLLAESRSVIGELEEEKIFLKQQNVRMADELSLLRHRLFGSTSEKLTEEDRLQRQLFDEAEMAAESPTVEEPAETQQVKSYQRRKPKRRPLPANLPREEVVHDIAEEEKVCSCGHKLVRIGEETSEKLDIVPAQMKVIRHIRPKYACATCEGEQAGEHAAVKIAPVPAQIIPKGIASAGLLAYILVSKFVDALPLYRQEKQFQRIGIDIPRSTMGDWTIEAARKCEPLVELMHKEVLSGVLIQMDETPVQVMKEQGRQNAARSYIYEESQVIYAAS